MDNSGHICCVAVVWVRPRVFAWRDPSPLHRTVHSGGRRRPAWRSSTGVGAGRNIVLLAGSGSTAHVFDDFAEEAHSLRPRLWNHAKGIRRSSHPESGYDDQRLADDVLRVLQVSHISKPVLVGHSYGWIRDDHTRQPASGACAASLGLSISMRETARATILRGRLSERCFDKLPASVTSPAHASTDDRKSFQAYRGWQTRTMKFAFPESELRQRFDAIRRSIGRTTRGSRQCDLSQKNTSFADDRRRFKETRLFKIRVPILYLPAAPARRRMVSILSLYAP